MLVKKKKKREFPQGGIWWVQPWCPTQLSGFIFSLWGIFDLRVLNIEGKFGGGED